jgi:hypothetical protein
MVKLEFYFLIASTKHIQKNLKFVKKFDEEKFNHTGLIHHKKEKNRLKRNLKGPYSYGKWSKIKKLKF